MLEGVIFLIIHYDTEELNRLIKNIFDLTGVSISVLDSEYRLITNCSLPIDYCRFLQKTDGEQKKCEKSDIDILDRCKMSKKPECHICRAGLCDYAMPIIKNDSIVGYIIMGRVRSESSPSTAVYIPDNDSATLKKLDELYMRLPVLTAVQLGALYDLLPSVIFNSAIKLIYNDTVSRAVEFIEKNLNRRISVELICHELHLSPSSLYREFHESLGTTVTEYIINCRLKNAMHLLESTDLPIYAVAERCGIDNYTYFCHFFKKKIGATPTMYRRSKSNLQSK